MSTNNEPIPEERAGREATEGFEEWWLANGPCEGNSSYRKIGWALTVMKNMCEKSWNAAQLAAQPSVQRNSNGWIEIIGGVRWPTGEDHLLVVRGPEETQMQCVGYWNRLMKTWLVNGERHDGLDVTHYKLLDWPSITAERGSK